MTNSHVISALRLKRAEISGHIHDLEKRIARQRANLANLDATIKLFSPGANPDAIPPKRPCRRTRYSWCASDAIIIPVRVDEHSIDSLELTLDMLDNPDSDYNIWANRAGGVKSPKVAAIVMTMVGARSPIKGVKDLASRMYIERAYEVAAKHSELFDDEDPADAFVITDDFMSAGRISGALSISYPST